MEGWPRSHRNASRLRTNSMPPDPAFPGYAERTSYPVYPSVPPKNRYGRRRAGSRYVEELGRSKQRHSHRYGNELHNQIASADVQDEMSPSRRYAVNNLDEIPYHDIAYPFGPFPQYDKLRGTRPPQHEPPKEHHYMHARTDDAYQTTPHHHISYNFPARYSDNEDSWRSDESSPLGLSFGFSLGFFGLDGNTRVPLAKTPPMSLERGWVRGSKSIVGDDSKMYRESIFNISSSRYTNFSDRGLPCEAELNVQPPAAASQRSLHPLLNWM